MTKKTKNIITALVIVLFLVLGAFEGFLFYVGSQVDPQAYQQQILEAVKAQTGKNIKINGTTRFLLFPTPKLLISKLEVDTGEADNFHPVPKFVIEQVELNLSISSILSRQFKLSGMTLLRPTLSVASSDDGVIHWDWINSDLIKLLNVKNESGTSVPLSIRGGTVKYTDIPSKKDYALENIEAYTVYGSQVSLSGKMKLLGKMMQFVVDSKTADLPVTDSQLPINVNFSDGDKNSLLVQSIIDMNADVLKISGKFKLLTDDVLVWFENANNDGNNPAVITQTNKLEGNVPSSKDTASAEIVGGWNLDSGIVQMSEISVKGLNSQGNGSMSVGFNNWKPVISAKFDFEYLDYLLWKKLVDVITAPKDTKRDDAFDDDNFMALDFHQENRLPENLELEVEINAKKILFGKEEWGDAYLNAALDKGAFTINQCDIALNGGGILSVFGVISQGGDGKLRFEGNMEASGKSLREAIATFYSSAHDLPKVAGTGEFSISANMYVNAEQIRLFEASISVDETPVFGAITVYLETQTRIEARIRLKDINFDHLRDSLRKQRIEDASKPQVMDDKTGNTEDKKPIITFDWLRNLSIRFDAAVYIEGFTFMERKGDRASFAIYAYRGDLRLSNGQLTYPDGTNEINCSFDVRGARPYVGLMVSADRLDTNYFSLEEEPVIDESSSQEGADIQQSKEKYASSPIPLEWMNYFNGSFDITLRKFTHKNLYMEKIKLQARLDNNILSIQRLGFIYSQAQSLVTGTIYGGRVPGMLVSFTMSNADTYELLLPLIGTKNISGYASLSGTVSTAGWNFKEWLDNMDSKFLIAARSIKMQGVNIAGVINVVDVALSSADVFNNVNNVLTKGTTEFSVDGQLSIKDGELILPKLALRTGLVSGVVQGKIKLESLVGQLMTEFRFPNLAPEAVPTMIVQLSGKIDSPDIKVDTASLEDYVAKKNVAK